MSQIEREILKVLIDKGPKINNQDIVYSGNVKSVREQHGVVTIILKLDDHYRSLKPAVMAAVELLPWVKEVNIQMEEQATAQTTPSTGAGFQDVSTVLAVSSCKGGVGKSTVAVNLAYSLAALGLRVGLFDADIYGPSLPTMVTPSKQELSSLGGDSIVPHQVGTVKLMSYGYLQDHNEAAAAKTALEAGETPEQINRGTIMRGPMAGNLVVKLLSSTVWGELDYLLLDMPPGTGDIQLSLAQQLKMHAALVVTTPAQLSYVDVAKGIDMFQKVDVPVVGVVENMAYFKCGTCDTLHRPFGPSSWDNFSAQFGVSKFFELPIVPAVSRAGDSGVPLPMQTDEATSEVRHAYATLATDVHSGIQELRQSAGRGPQAAFKDGVGLVLDIQGEPERVVNDMHKLRALCACAQCVAMPQKVAPGVQPKRVSARGSYAVEIQWSDGHRSMFPYTQLLSLSHPSR